MRLPTWQEVRKQPEQLEVLEHPLDESLFVAGPPGSGKSVLALRRATLAAQAGGSSVALVTYNRMLRRLLNLMDDRGEVDVSTMHSFVWQDYKRRTRDEPPNDPAHQFAHDWKAMLDRLREDGRASPDKLHLVVDEGQDLPEGFFRYATRHVAKAMTVFADEDQAIGERRTTLKQIKTAANLPDPRMLTLNHRNTPEIAKLAEHFHRGRLPVATVLRARSGELPRFVRSEHPEATAVLISNWVKNRGGNIGVVVAQQSFAGNMHARLRGKLRDSRVDVYDSRRKNEGSIDLLEDGVTVLNRESVKGQEFDAVFILELDRFIPFADESARRGMYMMCTRARDNLFLVHDRPSDLSHKAAAELPGPDVLERFMTASDPPFNNVLLKM